jgi:hypothetical protein
MMAFYMQVEEETTQREEIQTSEEGEKRNSSEFVRPNG